MLVGSIQWNNLGKGPRTAPATQQPLLTLARPGLSRSHPGLHSLGFVSAAVGMVAPGNRGDLYHFPQSSSEEIPQ